MAKEKVTLFGLTIVAERRVRYSAIDPAASRELLIQHGLVEGELDTRAEFFRHNRALLSRLEKLAAKTRQRELLVEPHAIYRFFDARLPPEVSDAPRLEKWRREAERKQPKLLFLSETDVIGGAADEPVEQEFPDELHIDRLKLPLEYHFEPGAEGDGITLTVPREGLPQVTEDRLAWLVPGLVTEKIEALVRSLPKALRRELGPAPDVAHKIAAELTFAKGSLHELVAVAVGRLAGQTVSPNQFDSARLPPHLRLNVRVVDRQGQTLNQSRELAVLKEQLVPAAPAVIVPADSRWHRDGITKWDFGELPASVELRSGGVTLTKYPALVDDGESAALRLVDSVAAAARQTRAGALRLFVLAERRGLKSQVQWLPQIEKIRLYGAPLATARPIDEQLIDLLASQAFYAQSAIPRDSDDFEAQRLFARRQIVPIVQEVAKVAWPLFEAYYAVRLALEQQWPAAVQYAVDDIRGQLAALVPPGFLTATPWDWLAHYPRYLRAMSLRLGKLGVSAARDREHTELVGSRWLQYQQRLAGHCNRGIDDPELARFRWMLEELRVSLFAQELGTSLAVSPQRLDKQWQKVHP
jgi:ATP-dependent helicase HrpA